jgi:integrase
VADGLYLRPGLQWARYESEVLRYAAPFQATTNHVRVFVWHLRCRGGVYYADGRYNKADLGKHSLGTRDRAEALENLKKLDRKKAIELGILVPSKPPTNADLPIEEGWRIYMEDRKKPQLFGGISEGSAKRYESVRAKHEEFCRKHGILLWQQINAENAEAYGLWLGKQSYADRTTHFEVTEVKTVMNWLIDQKRLSPEHRVVLLLVKPEGCDAYCYTIEQVSDMVLYCKANELVWLADVLIGLACTGLRINELASLRWSDLDQKAGMLRLTDERWSHRRIKLGSARHTKGKRTRCLPIHPDLMKVLVRLPKTVDGLIFHGPLGSKLQDSTVLRNLKDNVIDKLKSKYPTPPGELGFEHGKVHSMRHYFCSESFRNGATEAQLLEWLGHRDSKMVAHYRRLRPDDSKKLMSSMRLLDLNPGQSETA